MILKTNGASASRDQYANAAQAVVLARSPNFAVGATFAQMIYTVDYVFSGQRSPTVDRTSDSIPIESPLDKKSDTPRPASQPKPDPKTTGAVDPKMLEAYQAFLKSQQQ